IEGRDAAGNPTGSFGAGDTAVNLGYSRRLADYPAVVGGSVKYIRSSLANVSAQSYAVDLGVQRPFYALDRRATLRLSVRHLGQRRDRRRRRRGAGNGLRPEGLQGNAGLFVLPLRRVGLGPTPDHVDPLLKIGVRH